MIAASKRMMSAAEGSSRKRKAEPLAPEVVKAVENVVPNPVVAEPVVAASAAAAEMAAPAVSVDLTPNALLARAMAASFDY